MQLISSAGVSRHEFSESTASLSWRMASTTCCLSGWSNRRLRLVSTFPVSSTMPVRILEPPISIQRIFRGIALLLLIENRHHQVVKDHVQVLHDLHIVHGDMQLNV